MGARCRPFTSSLHRYNYRLSPKRQILHQIYQAVAGLPTSDEAHTIESLCLVRMKMRTELSPGMIVLSSILAAPTFGLALDSGPNFHLGTV